MTLGTTPRFHGPWWISRWPFGSMVTIAGRQGPLALVALRHWDHGKLGLVLKRGFSSSSTCWCSNSSHRVEITVEETLPSRRKHIKELLSRKWLARQPDTKLSKIRFSSAMETVEHEASASQEQVYRILTDDCRDSQTEHLSSSFYVIRDDLLHPLLGGNKLRKLDALIPLLEDLKATDVVTCGGSQSAHTAALAYACAERGMRAHLLLRGEAPSIPTGYNLLSGMYGYSKYVPRSEYADRTAMFKRYSEEIAGPSGEVIWLDEPATELETGQRSEKQVIVVREGAGEAVALLGVVRLVEYLSRPSVFGGEEAVHIVVDSGTGTTAVGLALGILLLKLPWKITGVMLADSVEAYEAHMKRLVAAFCSSYATQVDIHRLPLAWEERRRPRRFGKIFPDEIRKCQLISRQTGILLDPIYTLAGWELAFRLAFETRTQRSERVALLHTGGTLGLFGLAQRYPEEFI